MHYSAMTDVTKKPEAIVAKFEGDSPLAKSDIKYVLGTGQVYQNYLDKDLKLLPGKWLVKEQKWVKAEPVDGATQCVGCHTTNFDPDSKTWTELGVGCEACHGPGDKHSQSMDTKDIADLRKLDAKKLNMVCGQCHSHGADLSGKYAFPPDFMPGDDLEKIFKLSEATGGVVNSQYNTFLTSKHAAGGMECTSCHDTHGDKAKDKHQLRKPVNDLCLGCHKLTLGTAKAIADLKSHAPSAGPDATCAACHMPGGMHAFGKGSKQ
jgi:predicted CXXCH cytochrome family protein